MHVARLFSLAVLTVLTTAARAQEIDRHLAGGEFSAARKAAQQLPGPDRDPLLGQIARAQSFTGESTAAGDTIREIRSYPVRDQVISEARGAGGGSFADFQSLMDLIQTTVVPDTWEALGGPSTMAPYPQGVYVDSEGTIRECETFAKSDAVADLKSLLSARSQAGTEADIDGTSWRRPAPMRCVSLRRLLDELSRQRMTGVGMTEAMTHMAGLSRIQYLFLEGDDILVAGPVGGIDTFQGWYRDRVSGLNTLRLDFLFTCLASAVGNQPFGCTIDPTTEGLQRAAQVSKDVQADRIPIGKADEAMQSALGMQRVEVFGTAADTAIGYLMVEADRHMKQLALGIDPMPRGAHNYLDMIDASIDKGPPNELLLRLWFTAAPRSVRADQNRTVFELAGTPIRLSGQNERQMASGQRGNITRDFRTEAFVDQFNQNWNAISAQYPVYGALESIYRVASVSELIDRHSESPELRWLIDNLAAQGSTSSWMLAPPKQVESIAVLHRVRHGRRVHHVLLASGGVAVDAKQTLVSKIVDYPSLDSITNPAEQSPVAVQRWWWDVKQ